MATREGKVALLSDVLEELKGKLKEGFETRGIKEVDVRKVNKIAAATVKYSMLSASRDRNVNFDMETILDFQGNTAVALLYAKSRINSLLRNSGVENENVNLDDFKFELATETEKAMLHKLGDFPSLVGSLLRDKESMPLVRYLNELRNLFSRYYEETQILNPTDPYGRKMSKIILMKGLDQVIGNGMNILGIEPVENF